MSFGMICRVVNFLFFIVIGWMMVSLCVVDVDV